MNYEELHWETLEYVKAHMYRRLADPISKISETLERVRNSDNKERNEKKLLQGQHTTEALLNTVNAWATLITYKENGPLDSFQFQPLTTDKIPAWFRAYFEQQTTLKVTFEHEAQVHLETFLESILLLYSVASAISKVGFVQITDAIPPTKGIYVRIAFSNLDEKAPYESLGDIMKQFDYQNMPERDLAFQLAVARDMMSLNHSKFSLQNNKKTGHQAFSSYFPVRTMPTRKDPNPYTAEAKTPHPDDPLDDLKADPPTPTTFNLKPDETDKLKVLSREAGIRATHSIPKTTPEQTEQEANPPKADLQDSQEKAPPSEKPSSSFIW